MFPTLALLPAALAAAPLPRPLPAPLPLTWRGQPADGARVLTWSKADPWVAAGIVGVLAPTSLLWPAPDPTDLAPGALHAGDTLTDGPFTMSLTVDERWRTVSDVLGFGTGFGLAAAVIPYEIGADGWVQRDLGRAGIALEATVTTLSLTTVLKKVAARPRPYTHVTPDELGAIGSVGEEALAEEGSFDAEGTWTWTDPDAIYAWPSGHTSGVAGGAFAVTTIALYSQPHRRPVDYLWYAVPAALTATTGYARVRATKHAPTDVISGGLLGAACGVLIPLAHVREGGPRLAVTGDGAALVGQW